MRTICKLKHLTVLEVDGKIKCLPDEFQDLVLLKYLGLFRSDLRKLPPIMGKLQNLQTLLLIKCRLRELPRGVLDIQSLRHLIMYEYRIQVRVPRRIGKMKNLRTLHLLYATEHIAEKLSKLTQLRQLQIMHVSENHFTELSASIMKMTNLVRLSMKAEWTTIRNENPSSVQLFPEMEAFSPPPLVQEVSLSGHLIEIPSWLASMPNLMKLNLSNSNLSHNQTSELQFLPKLQHLRLGWAVKEKRICKDFCDAGGFPSLKTLEISSDVLVEWTEIANGAFPSLESLIFRYCRNFRFFPNGLRNICTLKNLVLSDTHGDLKRRLEGEENYKIKHIPNVQWEVFY